MLTVAFSLESIIIYGMHGTVAAKKANRVFRVLLILIDILLHSHVDLFGERQVTTNNSNIILGLTIS